MKEPMKIKSEIIRQPAGTYSIWIDGKEESSGWKKLEYAEMHLKMKVRTMKKQNIKIHLQHYYTKRDMYGNVYHAVKIVNIKNGKSFLVSTPSLGNVTGILCGAFGGWQNCQYIVSEIPTHSARLSSLPQGRIENLNPCSFEDCKPYKGSWKAELNKIGFKLPRKAKK